MIFSSIYSGKPSHGFSPVSDTRTPDTDLWQTTPCGAFLWSNTARSFDGVKARPDLEEWGGWIDMFAVNVVEHDWGELNDIWANEDDFYGIYSNWTSLGWVDFRKRTIC